MKTKKELAKIIPIKMDYFKWQLRTDLTNEKGKDNKYKNIDIIIQSELKAKGWNACRKEILKRIREVNTNVIK